MMYMIDFLGKDVTEGDVIVYSPSRSAEMVRRIVVSVYDSYIVVDEPYDRNGVYTIRTRKLFSNNFIVI